MIRPFLPLALLPLTVACAADPTVYPSLARRPVERLGFEEPATPPPAPVAPDPALDATIVRVVGTRRVAADAFDRAATRTEALARTARGVAVGSDRWLDAQTALSELDSLRASHADAVGELEDLASTRAQALAPDYAPLQRALEEARAAGAAQTQRIDAITATLPGT